MVKDITHYDKFTSSTARPNNGFSDSYKKKFEETASKAHKNKKFLANLSGWKSEARYGHFRCNICDTTKAPFYPDPDRSKSGYLCTPCTVEYQDVMSMWSIEDELLEENQDD